VPTRLARRLAAEALQLSQLDPELGARISELWLEEDGSFGMVLVEPRVEIRFRAPLTIPVLDRGLWTLQDALDQAEEAVPMHLDLRFADRVFLRFDRATLRPVP